MTSPGSGYTEIPTVSVIDNGENASIKGAGATFQVRTKTHEKGVVMGVCTSEDATAATTFKFKAPVYLLPSETYAFVLKSPNSVEYTSYCSKLGENLIGTEVRVVQQPSLGSLFKSQNGTLWTEDQTQDITFELRRCRFIVDTQASVHLQNTPLKQEFIGSDPIETNNNAGSGDAFGDNPKVAKIYRGNHGLHAGDLVEIRGVVGDIGGIPGSTFNTVHTVLRSDFNHFTVMMNDDATENERGGGTIVSITAGKPYEVLFLETGAMVFPGASFNCTVNTAIGQSISGFNAGNAYTRNIPLPVDLIEDIYFPVPQVIGNYLSEAKYSGPSKLGGERSFQLDINMKSNTDRISPVVDLQRTAATVIRNLVENFSPADPIYGPKTSTVTFDSTFNKADVASTLEFDGTSAQVSKVIPSINKVLLRGSSIPTNTSVITGALADLGIASVSNSDSGYYWTPETNPEGSSFAKWISRTFQFENPCDGIEIRLTSLFYNVTNIRCYYKLKAVGFDGEISNNNWIEFNPEQTVDSNDSEGQIQTIQMGALADNANQVKPRTYSDVNPYFVKSDEYETLTFSAQDLAQFDGVAVKIVMTADNPCQTPLINDMVIICSE